MKQEPFNLRELPDDLLSCVLERLAEYSCEDSERYQTLTPDSKQSIFNARLVSPRFLKNQGLRWVFVKAVEQTPFVISDCENKRGWISGLKELSGSGYAAMITTISICPMVFDEGLQAAKWPPRARKILVEAISAFPNLKEARYHTLPPEYIQGARIADRSPGSNLALPEDILSTFDEVVRPHYENQYKEYVGPLHLYFLSKSQNIETITMPHHGNAASFCAIPSLHMRSYKGRFAMSLRRVTINLMVREFNESIFGDWLYRCPNLEFLEIALCRESTVPSSDRLTMVQIFRSDKPSKGILPSKLEEVRVLTDTGFTIAPDYFVSSLKMFPALKKLALGNFLFIGDGLTPFFNELKELQDDTQREKLDVLWLLNPTYAGISDGLPFRRYDYEDNPAAKEVVKELRIRHTKFPWEEKELHVGYGRGYAYPRFEEFESEHFKAGERAEKEDDASGFLCKDMEVMSLN